MRGLLALVSTIFRSELILKATAFPAYPPCGKKNRIRWQKCAAIPVVHKQHSSEKIISERKRYLQSLRSYRWPESTEELREESHFEGYLKNKERKAWDQHCSIFDSVDKNLKLRATELHFPVVLFITRLSLWNEKYFPVALLIWVFKSRSNFWVCG